MVASSNDGRIPPVDYSQVRENFINSQIAVDWHKFQPNPRVDQIRRNICGHLFDAMQKVYAFYPDAVQEHASFLVLNCLKYLQAGRFLAGALVLRRENGEKTLGSVNLDAEIDGLFAHIHDLSDEAMAKIAAVVCEHQEIVPATEEPE